MKTLVFCVNLFKIDETFPFAYNLFFLIVKLEPLLKKIEKST